MAKISNGGKPLPRRACRRKRSERESFPPLRAIAIFWVLGGIKEKSKMAFLTELSNSLPSKFQGGAAIGIAISIKLMGRLFSIPYDTMDGIKTK